MDDEIFGLKICPECGAIMSPEEEYFDFLMLGSKAIWNEEKVYFVLENGDWPAIMENERISKIKFKNLSNEYKANITFLVNDIDEGIGNKAIKNIIKSL